jgi:hypothetical protein
MSEQKVEIKTSEKLPEATKVESKPELKKETPQKS